MIDIQMNGLNSVHQCAVPAINKPNHTHTHMSSHTHHSMALSIVGKVKCHTPNNK